MNRDKNGRFFRAKKIEISIPSLASFLKYLFLLVIFLPLLYLSIIKLDLIEVCKKGLTTLFGPIDCECDCENPSRKNPY